MRWVLTTWEEEKITLRFINIYYLRGGWKRFNISVNVIICLSVIVRALLIHLQLYFQTPFISNHQFVAGKITTAEKKNLQNPHVSILERRELCSVSQSIVDKTIHFLLPLPLKFSDHCRDACDLEEEGRCLPERSTDLLTAMY